MSSFPAFSHYALTVSNLQRSIEWYERLFNSPPVAVNEHGEILDRSYGAGLAFRDPDNIQLEFFLPMGS